MHNRPAALIKAAEKVIARERHLGLKSARRDQWRGGGHLWVTRGHSQTMGHERRDTSSSDARCWLGPINNFLCYLHFVLVLLPTAAGKVVSILLLSLYLWVREILNRERVWNKTQRVYRGRRRIDQSGLGATLKKKTLIEFHFVRRQFLHPRRQFAPRANERSIPHFIKSRHVDQISM